jgi:hypothetical protein
MVTPLWGTVNKMYELLVNQSVKVRYRFACRESGSISDKISSPLYHHDLMPKYAEPLRSVCLAQKATQNVEIVAHPISREMRECV